MDIEKNKLKKIYELLPLKSHGGFGGGVVGKTRVLVGRAQSCDIVIDKPSISAIHAIVEVKENTIKVYDMNSTNGTFVNGKKDFNPAKTFLI